MTTTGEVPPQPVPDEDSRGFWEALDDGRLAVCRCQGCRRWLQPPLERCPRCWGATAFEPVSGQGEVFSFIVVRQPAIPGFRHQLPYSVVLVELAEQEGLRLPGRLGRVRRGGGRCPWWVDPVLASAGKRASGVERLQRSGRQGCGRHYDEVARRTAELLAHVPSLDATHAQAFLRIVAETAQHAGHADILREATDGAKTMG